MEPSGCSIRGHTQNQQEHTDKYGSLSLQASSFAFICIESSSRNDALLRVAARSRGLRNVTPYRV